MGSSTQRVSLKIAGSFSRTHTSLGAVKPGMAMLPVMSRERGSAFSSVAHCCSLRPSFHRMAGRSGLSPASSRVAPCIWPDRPTALTALRDVRRQCLHRGVGGAPPVGGILFGPAGVRTGNIERRGGLLHHGVLVVDDDGLDTGSADIDAEIHPPSPMLRRGRPKSGGNATRIARRGGPWRYRFRNRAAASPTENGRYHDSPAGSQRAGVNGGVQLPSAGAENLSDPVRGLARQHPLRVFAGQCRGLADGLEFVSAAA